MYSFDTSVFMDWQARFYPPDIVISLIARIEGLIVAGQCSACEDLVYLEGAYRGQVNGKIQDTYSDLARYEELADPKYTDTGGIFDIMAVTVIQSHLAIAA